MKHLSCLLVVAFWGCLAGEPPEHPAFSLGLWGGLVEGSLETDGTLGLEGRLAHYGHEAAPYIAFDINRFRLDEEGLPPGLDGRSYALVVGRGFGDQASSHFDLGIGAMVVQLDTPATPVIPGVTLQTSSRDDFLGLVVQGGFQHFVGRHWRLGVRARLFASYEDKDNYGTVVDDRETLYFASLEAGFSYVF